MAYTGTIPDAGTSTEMNSYVEQFRSNVIHLAQQKTSRLRSAVRNVTVKGEKHNIERLGFVEAHQKTTRHALTPIMDTPHSRRVLSMNDYQWADLVDEEDKIRMLISPESEYAKSGAKALGRQFDREIITALGGNSVDGDGNNVALSAGQIIAHGSTGMTIAKLLEIKQKLDANEVDKEDRFIVMKADDYTDLLNTTEVTSGDYNTVRALVRGEIDTFMGFKFLHTELLDTTTNVNTCFAWQKNAMCLGIGRDIITRMDPRPDVSYAQQVYLAFTAGAIRVEEEGVVQFSTDHS